MPPHSSPCLHNDRNLGDRQRYDNFLAGGW
jgi:hypothetical protein